MDESQFRLIQYVTERFRGLSRTERAATRCEQRGWLRPSGQPKTVECRQWLERLAVGGLIRLADRRSGRPRGSCTGIAAPEGVPSVMAGSLSTVGPVTLARVVGPAAGAQWRALIDQSHPLGDRVPFGAALRYFIQSPAGVLGGLQFSRPAWRLHARDQWIGWDDIQRRRGRQQIVCNSRFLILPTVRVPPLASHVLGQAARRIGAAWAQTCGVTLWLLETRVDPAP